MILQSSRVSGDAPSSDSAPLHRAAPGRQGQAARKILIVDDDQLILKAFGMRLESQGYKVVAATDGSQALNLARRERPDLVLLDVNFPPDIGGVDWDGFRIAQWLKMNEEVGDVPVLVMSGSERPEYQHRAAEMGAAGFLPKSISSEGMLACIDMALSHKKNAQPATQKSFNPGFAAEPAFHSPPIAPKSSEISAHLKIGTI